jgi:hypothetical protein
VRPHSEIGEPDDPIPVLDTHFLIRDPVTQRVIGMATITRDISTQKAQRDALEQANQRAAKGGA